MSILNLNFFMIYIAHKILVLIKNHLNYLKPFFKKTSFLMRRKND